MLKRAFSPALPALAALAAAPALADAADARFAIVAGYDAGGDKIVNINYSNGKTDSIRANEGLRLGAGVSLLNEAGNVEFLGTASVKYLYLHADNANLTWMSFPLDALVFYRRQSFRLGGGLTYAMNPQILGSGAAASVEMKLDNELGAVLQGDYLVGPISLGLRYTMLEYKLSGSTVKSNGLGISFGFTF